MGMAYLCMSLQVGTGILTDTRNDVKNGIHQGGFFFFFTSRGGLDVKYSFLWYIIATMRIICIKHCRLEQQATKVILINLSPQKKMAKLVT